MCRDHQQNRADHEKFGQFVIEVSLQISGKVTNKEYCDHGKQNAGHGNYQVIDHFEWVDPLYPFNNRTFGTGTCSWFKWFHL